MNVKKDVERIKLIGIVDSEAILLTLLLLNFPLHFLTTCIHLFYLCQLGAGKPNGLLFFDSKELSPLLNDGGVLIARSEIFLTSKWFEWLTIT